METNKKKSNDITNNNGSIKIPLAKARGIFSIYLSYIVQITNNR